MSKRNRGAGEGGFENELRQDFERRREAASSQTPTFLVIWRRAHQDAGSPPPPPRRAASLVRAAFARLRRWLGWRNA